MRVFSNESGPWIRLLKKFAKREGHTAVPSLWTENGYKLGRWVRTQRELYVAGRLDPEREEWLEGLPGWTWNGTDAQQRRWKVGLVHLQEYVAREDHVEVPNGYRAGKFPLGQWVRNNRKYYAMGRLSSERIRLLEEVSGWCW